MQGCADEPIRVPGAIQPHGVLLAMTEPTLRIVMASANAAAVLGRDITGAALPDVLDPADFAAVSEGLAGDLSEANPLHVRCGGANGDLVLHRAGGLLVAEWEPTATAAQAGSSWHRRLPRVLQRLSGTASLDELTSVLASAVRELTGFDRVMVYRFDRDWNGEVVAEDRCPDLEPFLGLHYPAGDIPPQARDLYLANWLRLIPDATYEPVPLVPARNPLDGQPLDLSGAVLRSVSPVHLEYLANMGVVASMSVSLIDQGRLWGLIACHHYAGPHRPSYGDRVAAEFLGRTASLLLASKASSTAREQILHVTQSQGLLLAKLAHSPRAPLDALVSGEPTLLDLLPATGAAVRLDGRLSVLGRTPPAERVVPLVRALLATGSWATDSLTRVVPDAHDVVDTASGLLVAEMGTRPGDFLAWFRAESLREVDWGGDPHTTKVVEDDTGPRLSPRRSFDRWRETIRATAAPWEAHEVLVSRNVANSVTQVALRRVEEDNRHAAALQRTLLLGPLPKVRRLTLAARYAPSAKDVVGGDWYDLVLLPSGRASLVLGDVAGHGLPAAAITAQVRHALRAHLLLDEGPAVALEQLNQLVNALLPGELATAIVAEVDPETGTVAIVNAGHPPVLRLAGSGASFVDAAVSPPLGVLDAAGYRATQVTLRGDDRLVLYSDGLVERRDNDLEHGLELLRSAAEGISRADPERLLDDVLAALAPPATDDVTLLAVGLS